MFPFSDSLEIAYTRPVKKKNKCCLAVELLRDAGGGAEVAGLCCTGDLTVCLGRCGWGSGVIR